MGRCRVKDVVPPPDEVVGPQAAAQRVIEVDAVPDDGGASGPAGGAPPHGFDARAEWHQAVKLGVKIPTDLLATKLPFWKLSEEELNALADGWAPMLAEWFPDAIPQWVIALGATGMILGPRAWLTYELVQEAKKRAREGGASSASPPRAEPSPASSRPSNDAPRDPGTGYPDRLDPQVPS